MIFKTVTVSTGQYNGIVTSDKQTLESNQLNQPELVRRVTIKSIITQSVNFAGETWAKFDGEQFRITEVISNGVSCTLMLERRLKK